MDQLSQVDVENAIRADLARRQRRDEEALWGTVGEMVGGMVEGIKKTNAVLMEEKVKAAGKLLGSSKLLAWRFSSGGRYIRGIEPELMD